MNYTKSLFCPFIVRDSRIQQIQDQIPLSIYTGAKTTSLRSYTASTESTNQLDFVANIPSENSLLDRELLIGTTINFEFDFTVPQVAAGPAVTVFQYSDTHCLGVFPFN